MFNTWYQAFACLEICTLLAITDLFDENISYFWNIRHTCVLEEIEQIFEVKNMVKYLITYTT